MKEKKIELVLPEIEHTQGFAMQNAAKGFSIAIDEIKEWFDSYDIDYIQLWISGAVEAGGVLKLFLSASGEGGVSITLRPKRQKERRVRDSNP